jgi:hypothetical protein
MKQVFLGQTRDQKKHPKTKKIWGASRQNGDTKSPFVELWTITLDPTFGSFTLLELVSH